MGNSINNILTTCSRKKNKEPNNITLVRSF